MNVDGDARAIVSKRNNVGDNESYLIFYYTSDQLNVDIDGNGDRFNTATTFSSNNNYLIDLLYDGTLATASRVKIYIDGNLDVTKSEASAAIPNYNSPATIGSLNIGDGRPFGGYIAEVIIFRKALNNAERFIVDNYLSSKYNITLTANDFYAGDTPANGDYDFEVAGIGTDASGSNASASSSVSGGLSVAQLSGFQNGDYLIYGHNSVLNNTNTTDIAGMTGANPGRWNRIWYADVTNVGANEAVNLTFDMSDAGSLVMPTIASNYVLLYRAGLTGSWTELVNASSISGDQINFPGVTFSSNGYYTLGSHNITNSPLPVELIGFTGTFDGNDVELKWSTASEVHSNSFSVERSDDGKKFISIVTLPGAGTSTTLRTYSAKDIAPSAVRSYYRLRQTEEDGHYSYSKIISVLTFVITPDIQVFPNPAANFFSIKVTGDSATAQITIFNDQGQVVPFHYSESGGLYVIDIQTFTRGIYLIRVFHDNRWEYKKFIVE